MDLNDITIINTIPGLGKDDPIVAPIPTELKLYQAYPNPFNPSTNIAYDIPYESRVSLVVYNNLGEEVNVLVHAIQSAGRYSTIFDGSRYESGTYYYRLTVADLESDESTVLVKQMVLVK